MSGRFHPHFFASDYERCVVAKGRCRLDVPPEEYRPLFTAVDFPSHGFRTMFGSWVVKRTMHPVSTPEYEAVLMFHAPGLGVVNMAEQFALDPSLTRAIALELGVNHPAVRGKDIIMSTDLVVTFRRPGAVLERCAYAVKRAQDLNERVIRKLAIEQAYWARRNTRWALLLDVHLPRQLIANMELLIEFAEASRLPCDELTMRQAVAWLVPHLRTGAPLRTVCQRCDAALDQPPGTALAVAYHQATQGNLPLGLRLGHLPCQVERTPGGAGHECGPLQSLCYPLLPFGASLRADLYGKLPRLAAEMRRQTETQDEFTLRRVQVIRQLNPLMAP